MRIELGAGALAGATVVVHADDGRVRVKLDAPAGAELDAWRTRLGQRLALRGVAVDELIVDSGSPSPRRCMNSSTRCDSRSMGSKDPPLHACGA